MAGSSRGHAVGGGRGHPEHHPLCHARPSDFFFGKHRYDAELLDMYGKLIEKMDGTVAKQRFGRRRGQSATPKACRARCAWSICSAARWR
jgi:hypothetical protein